MEEEQKQKLKEKRREGGDSRGKEINKKERKDVRREKRKHRRERERERKREERRGDLLLPISWGCLCWGETRPNWPPRKQKTISDRIQFATLQGINTVHAGPDWALRAPESKADTGHKLIQEPSSSRPGHSMIFLGLGGSWSPKNI